jgi:hypothetical protein
MSSVQAREEKKLEFESDVPTSTNSTTPSSTWDASSISTPGKEQIDESPVNFKEVCVDCIVDSPKINMLYNEEMLNLMKLIQKYRALGIRKNIDLPGVPNATCPSRP